MSFSRKHALVWLVFMLAVAAGGVYWLKVIHPYESTDNAYLKAHMSLISPKETGYVKKVLFEDNRNVSPGQVLVEIDDHDFRAKVARAEAQVLTETARIRTLEADQVTQKAKIRQQESDMVAAAADLERARKDLQRFRKLAAKGAVSAQTRDTAESAYRQAQAKWDKTRSARTQAQSELAALAARIAETRAVLQVAQAALDLARIDLKNTRIVAPFAGIIGNRSVQVGQLVKPGSVLAYLIPTEGLFVEANFKETQIGRMQPGQAVELSVDAFPANSFKGIVDSFAPASGAEFSLLPPENATGNFTKIVRRVPVKILFRPGTDLSRLRPGLSTVARVRVR